MFGTVLLAVVTLLHLYVFARAATVPAVARRVPGRALFAAAGILWAGFVAARFTGHGATGAAAAALESFGMNWLGALFLASVCLLAVDLVTGFGYLFRGRVPALRGVALLAGGVLTAVALVQGMRPPVVEDGEVRLPGLPATLDGTVVVAISDMHLGSQLDERWLAARIEQVRATRPDLVVLLGDIFEGHGPPRHDLARRLGTLSARLGVFVVPGNHESHGGWGGNGGLPIEESGFQVLRNRWVEVRPGLVLAGIDDIAAARRGGRGGNPAGRHDNSAARALAGRPPGAAILLSHSPLEAGQAAAAGASLMLSGHTHGGGQIWPLGYLVRRLYPIVDGTYQVNGMTVIVSRGAGTWGPRMRLWRPAQILRLTLRSPTAPSAQGGGAPAPRKGA